MRKLFWSLLLCALAAFTVTNATESATIKPVDSKVRPVPKKHSAVILKGKNVQRPGTSAFYPANGDLQNALKKQIWMAQHKVPVLAKRIRQTPLSTPAPPVSRNAQRASLRQSLQGFNHPSRRWLKAGQPARRKIPVIAPVAALPRTIEKARVEVMAVGSPASDDVRPQEGKGGSSAVLLGLVAVCIALAGTAAVLYVISKRAPQRNEPRVVRLEETQQPTLQVREFVTPNQKQLEEISILPNDLPEESNAVVELAQRFQRGQGEMQLIIDLQTHKEEKTSRTKLINTPHLSRVMGAKRKAAKKTGLGRGEVDLLDRLQKFQSSANHAQRML